MYFTRLREALDKRETELRSELDLKEQSVSQTYMSHSESAIRKEKLVTTAMDDVRRLCTENKIIFLQVCFERQTPVVSPTATLNRISSNHTSVRRIQNVYILKLGLFCILKAV